MCLAREPNPHRREPPPRQGHARAITAVSSLCLMSRVRHPPSVMCSSLFASAWPGYITTRDEPGFRRDLGSESRGVWVEPLAPTARSRTRSFARHARPRIVSWGSRCDRRAHRARPKVTIRAGAKVELALRDITLQTRKRGVTYMCQRRCRRRWHTAVEARCRVAVERNADQMSTKLIQNSIPKLRAFRILNA